MKLIGPIVMLALLAMFSACGDKKDSAARDQEVQKVLQEGMQKGVENIEKKLTDQKDSSKK